MKYVALILILCSVAVAKITTVEDITSTTQDFTGSWVDVGYPVKCLNVDKVGAWIDYKAYSSTGLRIRAVGKTVQSSDSDYLISEIYENTSEAVIQPTYYYLPAASTKYFVNIKTEGLIPWLQFQVLADTIGATNATVEGIAVTKTIEGR